MERKVGEIFEYNGEWYQCIHTKSLGCENCDLATKSDIHCSDVFEIRGECLSCYRKDGKSVIFKKLEKVGDPIRIENKSYQKIKVPGALCNNCAFCDNFSRDCKLNDYINHYPAYSCLKDEMFVEIKENKEDMNKKKLNLKKLIKELNLKEFDLEAAKAGKPVCTKDGRKARIICFDRNWEYPIVALIECENGEEMISACDKDGKARIYETQGTDLMMLPEKKEGWVNLCKNNYVDTLAVGVFPNREEAVSNCPPSYLCTIKIEWEE